MHTCYPTTCFQLQVHERERHHLGSIYCVGFNASGTAAVTIGSRPSLVSSVCLLDRFWRVTSMCSGFLHLRIPLLRPSPVLTRCPEYAYMWSRYVVSHRLQRQDGAGAALALPQQGKRGMRVQSACVSIERKHQITRLVVYDHCHYRSSDRY